MAPGPAYEPSARTEQRSGSLRKHHAADRVRVERDFPPEPIGIVEVSAVAAPIPLLGVVYGRPGSPRCHEYGVNFGRGRDVVRECERQRTTTSDLADFSACCGFSPQREHQLVANADHHNVAANVERCRPAETIQVEPARTVEVGNNEGNEVESRFHGGAPLPTLLRRGIRAHPIHVERDPEGLHRDLLAATRFVQVPTSVVEWPT